MGRSSRLALKGHCEALGADFNPSTARSVKYIIWGEIEERVSAGLSQDTSLATTMPPSALSTSVAVR